MQQSVITMGASYNRPVSSLSKNERLEIAERAYELWRAAGHPTGQDMEFWLQAEAELAASKHRRSRKANASEQAHKRDAAHAHAHHAPVRSRQAVWP
jgi:hypothetical protein